MAYDEGLADRVRALISRSPGVAERKMFGGLAFLIDGHMAVAASGEGGLMVRVDPDESDDLVTHAGAQFVEMKGREMRGWLRVDTDQVRTERELTEWVDRGITFVGKLPPKR